MRRWRESRAGLLQNPYLNVPNPPASSIMDGFSAIFLPIQRPANARRIWPCATTRTSHGSLSPFFASFILGSWKRDRILAINSSHRSVTCSGDLSNLPKSATKRLRLMLHYRDVLAHKSSKEQTHSPPGQPCFHILKGTSSPAAFRLSFISALFSPSYSP